MDISDGTLAPVEAAFGELPVASLNVDASRRIAGFSRRSLYLCTPDRPDLAAFVTACIAGGVDIVQLRDKRLDARSLIAKSGTRRA